MDEDSHVILTIWSHSHAPPLQPPADISFDLRRVSNPPKHIRDSYDGRSKRLREHLLHDATFTSQLDSAKEEILRFATERVGGANEQSSKAEETCLVAEDETVTSPPTSPPATGTSNRTASEDQNNDSDDYENEVASSVSNDEEAQVPAVSQSRKYGPSQEEPSYSSGEISDSSTSSSRLLRISCFCERGRHRSVAFAEELGRMAWPQAWDVRVQHRDVEGQGRGKRSKEGRSGRDEARRGGKRGVFGFGRDGYEP